MNFFKELREFLRTSYSRHSNRRRTLLLERFEAMVERDNFEAYMRLAGQLRGGIKA